MKHTNQDQTPPPPAPRLAPRPAPPAVDADADDLPLFSEIILADIMFTASQGKVATRHAVELVKAILHAEALAFDRLAVQSENPNEHEWTQMQQALQRLRPQMPQIVDLLWEKLTIACVDPTLSHTSAAPEDEPEPPEPDERPAPRPRRAEASPLGDAIKARVAAIKAAQSNDGPARYVNWRLRRVESALETLVALLRSSDRPGVAVNGAAQVFDDFPHRFPPLADNLPLPPVCVPGEDDDEDDPPRPSAPRPAPPEPDAEGELP
jgi:hypothetical protein